MFESNFPVDEGACSHQLLINAFNQLAHGASASEKADLFPGTAPPPKFAFEQDLEHTPEHANTPS
jgi:hypothetical protein